MLNFKLKRHLTYLVRSAVRFALGVPLALILAQSGCSLDPRTYTRGAGFNGIPAGSVLVLERTLGIAPEQVRAFIPQGHPPWRNQGAYAPHCDLEVWTKHPARFRVKPDSFAITGLRGGYTPILVRRGNEPVRVATNGPLYGLIALGSGGDEGTSFLRSYVEMFLRSERQPDVYKLYCSYMGDPFDMHLLSLEEIRMALTGTARLVLPGEEEKPSATRRSEKAPGADPQAGNDAATP